MSEVSQSVVKINTSTGTGSGFYLKNQDIVVTNHHVISGHASVAVETQDRDKHVARVIMVNPLLDLAFLKTAKPLEITCVPHIQSDHLQVSDKIKVLGFPFGMPFTVTEGIVSSPKQLLGGQSYIQTDAAVNPGNSGGPMVDEHGRIVGVTTCKFNDADNMGFALPAQYLLEEIKTYEQNPTDDYVVKCPSCNYLIVQEDEYCENCGQELDVDALFSQVKLNPVAEFVERCLRSMNIDPVIARNGPNYWQMHHGSALIRIFEYRNDFIFVTCPLVKLPKTNLEALYQYLLSEPIHPFCLGVWQGLVHISYRFHLSDLDSAHQERLQENLVQMIEKADDMDNLLIQQYGCEWSEESRQSPQPPAAE